MGNKQLEIRSDILKKVSSAEGTRVTPYLSLIYLRLVRASTHYWEHECVLRFTETIHAEQALTAWDQLLTLIKVSPDIARKSLIWLHNQEIINYSSTEDESEIIITFEGVYSQRGCLKG